MSPFSTRLLDATAADRAAFLAIPTLQLGADGALPLASYVAFLGEAYHHVRHTAPLLMACGSRLPQRLEWLRHAVAHYIEEEIGHDAWILDDLSACGVAADAVVRRGPSPATELMVAYAWDSVQRANPVGLFGMVLVLEGTSVSLATDAAARIQAALGLPDAAFGYLRSHGALDREHIAHFHALMDRLDDADDQAAVIHRARMFYRLYGDLFRTLPVPATGTPIPPPTTEETRHA